MHERFYRPTSENLSGKKKILKNGPLAAEITLMQKSNDKSLRKIGLRNIFECVVRFLSFQEFMYIVSFFYILQTLVLTLIHLGVFRSIFA